MPEKNEVIDANICALLIICILCMKTLKSHLKTKESYFIKKTTSGVPLVGSGSLSDFYFWRNKQLFSDLLYERPCTYKIKSKTCCVPFV